MKEKRPAIADEELALDEFGCLQNFYDWTLEFAESMAEEVGIAPPLTEAHKKIINYIRETVIRSGRTPIVHSACGDNGLKLWELERLFPAGYHRGACKLAGISYRQVYFQKYWLEGNLPGIKEDYKLKIYRIDAQGFLVDPSEWDENFTLCKAFEMKMPELLMQRHWQIINYLRDQFQRFQEIPTVYETCEKNKLDLESFNKLFPDGYHRGAVKLAGLRLA